MQPDRNPTDWQQPKEQVPGAPYVPASNEIPAEAPQPVVTMAPDTPPAQPTPPAEPTVDAPEQETAEQTPPASQTGPVEMQPVHWQAHEYIHHDKSPGWFVLFAIVVLGLIALAVFVMQSITFAILIPVMAAALLVYTHRPPRMLDYTLSKQGLHINDRLYAFAEFKAFGVIRDGEEYSVMLIPTKRFKPGVTVYFPEESGEAIVDMLGARLPMQTLHLDVIDRLIRKLRL